MRGISYGGYHFENNGWVLVVPPDFNDVTINARYIGRGQFPPVFVGVDRSSRIMPFILVNKAPGTSYETRYRQLERDCIRQDLGNQRALVVELDTGQQVTIQARFRGKQVRSGQLAYNVLFEAAESAFSSDGLTASITGPESPGDSLTLDIATSGTARTRPVIIATPLVRKDLDPSAFTFTITEAGNQTVLDSPYSYEFDHEALVDASESTAGGTDVLVEVDGAEVPRSLVGADTSTAVVTFPVSLEPGGTAEVTVRYKPAGQVYGLGTYFKGAATFPVTNPMNSARVEAPFRVTFDHAAAVSAGLSASDGDDVRLFVNGEEVARAIPNANNSSTAVWFPLAMDADEVVIVEVRYGGDDYSGSAYSNGSMDFSASTNTSWVYTTPAIDATSGTPTGQIRAALMRVNTSFPTPPRYKAVASTTGGNPAILTQLEDIIDAGGVGNVNGNYVWIYAGGMRITHLNTAVTWDHGVGNTLGRIADSADGSSWTSRYQTGGSSPSNYAARALGSNALYVAFGSEMNTGSSPALSSPYTYYHGQSTSELSITINSADVPTIASYTSPTAGSETATWSTTLNSTITDELDHELVIAGLVVREGRAVKIDAERRRIVLVDSNGAEIPGTAGPARAALRVNSPDHDWLALEPNTETTITWVEDSVEADGLQLDGSAADRWQ